MFSLNVVMYYKYVIKCIKVMYYGTQIKYILSNVKDFVIIVTTLALCPNYNYFFIKQHNVYIHILI